MARRLFTAFVLTPLTIGLAAPAIAQADQLAQVSAHLRSVQTMTASFVQTDRSGKSLSGTLTLKKPGKVRFQYEKGVPLLIVGDGRALNMIDYQVRQVSRWPIGGSPLAVLLDPSKDLSKVAKVVQGGGSGITVRARDPGHPEYGTITLQFTPSSGAPGGLMLQGWTAVDAQNNRTTVSLANQRFNVAVSDQTFRWSDPRPRGGRR